jgi:hypothetical protein
VVAISYQNFLPKVSLMATSTMTCSSLEMIVLKEGLSEGTAVQQSSIRDRREGSQSVGMGGRSP